MPLDYSKWDNIEISDDEDIEVHPNVDKRSFIKWNQEAIHQRRAERRNKIKQLQERIQVNNKVITQVRNILDGLVQTDPSNIVKVFSELERSATEIRGNSSGFSVDSAEAGNMSLEKIILNLFSQIQSDLVKENLEFSKENVMNRLQAELKKVEVHQRQCKEQLIEEEKIEKSTLTSDSICKPGFDKTIVNKDIKPPTSTAKKTPKKETKIEILNPKTLKTTPVTKVPNPSTEKKTDNDDSGDEDLEISDLSLAFSKCKNFDESFEFITKYPYFVDEIYSDELLTHAFECELKKDYEYAEKCVFQSLIITYCIRLGKDGVSLFFKKLNIDGVDMFKKDAKETYLLLKERSKIIAEKSAKESSKKSVFQLEPSSEDSKFIVNVPTEEDIERYKLFTSLPIALQNALKTAEIDPINIALADLDEHEAEQALHICDEGEFLLFDVPSEQPEATQISDDSYQGTTS